MRDLIYDTTDKYPSCNLCGSDKSVYEVRGEGKQTVISVCSECVKKMNRIIGEKTNE